MFPHQLALSNLGCCSLIVSSNSGQDLVARALRRVDSVHSPHRQQLQASGREAAQAERFHLGSGGRRRLQLPEGRPQQDLPDRRSDGAAVDGRAG